MMFFYAGHGGDHASGTWMFLNSNVDAPYPGQNKYRLEHDLWHNCGKHAGAYSMLFLACDRTFPSVFEGRGGTDTVPRPVTTPGQLITIYAVSENMVCRPNEQPNLAKEFLKQLEESRAPNGCIMLPGNLQYWVPCKWHNTAHGIP